MPNTHPHLCTLHNHTSAHYTTSSLHTTHPHLYTLHTLTSTHYIPSTPPLHTTHPHHCTLHTLTSAHYTPSPLHTTHPHLCTLHTLTSTCYTPSPLHTTHPHSCTHPHPCTQHASPCRNRAFRETSLLSWSGMRSLMPLYLWKKREKCGGGVHMGMAYLRQMEHFKASEHTLG